MEELPVRQLSSLVQDLEFKHSTIRMLTTLSLILLIRARGLTNHAVCAYEPNEQKCGVTDRGSKLAVLAVLYARASVRLVF